MFFRRLLTTSAFLLGVKAQADINGVTLYEKIEAMERQILQPFTLNFLVSPCSVNFNDDPNRGQQTSAEWVRIVFHDVITKNIAGPGLGGLDASISFESDREENIGIFVNVTIGQFSQFSSVFLSMADLIGLGLSDSLAACDSTSPRIPLRVGRMDAHEAGPFGVPGPLDSLQFAQDAFTRAGFTQTEMIQAIACGHSFGGVHHTNFPDIVPASQQSPTNHDGRASFDTTPAVFDHNIVKEYLDGTTQNPLVVGPVATRSDLRIFNSDGNVTMSNMNSAASFRTTCMTVFTKMINTVPNGAVLSDAIGPRPWILRAGNIDLSYTGTLFYAGTITGSGPGTRPTTASYVYKNSGGTVIATNTSQPGSEFPIMFNTPLGFGTMVDYAFNNTITSSATSIVVQNSYTRPINQNIFISGIRSFRNNIGDPNNGGTLIRQDFVVRAVVKSSLASSGTTMKLTLWTPAPQQGSLAPKIVSQTLNMSLKATVGSYKIYEVVAVNNDIANGAPVVQVKLHSSSGTVLQSTTKDETDAWASCSLTTLTNC